MAGYLPSSPSQGFFDPPNTEDVDDTETVRRRLGPGILTRRGFHPSPSPSPARARAGAQTTEFVISYAHATLQQNG